MRDERGFTLIEAVVALAIAALVLPVAIEAVTTGIRASVRAHTSRQAAVLAQSIIVQLGTTIPIDPGQVLEGTDAGFRWRVVSRAARNATEEPARHSDISLVEVSVTIERDSAPIFVLSGARAVLAPAP